MSFTDSIKSFVAKTTRSLEHDRQAIVVGVGDALIDGTPRGDPDSWGPKYKAMAVDYDYKPGHMAINMLTSVGAPIDEELTDGGHPWALPVDASGQVAKEMLRNNLGSGDCSVFITNNVPYCELIDQGWSPQAPAGIIDPVVADFQNIVAKAVAK